MPPRGKPWTPKPGSYPTDTATCPDCLQLRVRVLPSQHVLVAHKVYGDVATGSGPICSGSGKATPMTSPAIIGQRVVAWPEFKLDMGPLDAQHGTIVDTITNGWHKGDVVVHWDHDGSRTVFQLAYLHRELS